MDRKKVMEKYSPCRENLLSILHDMQEGNPEGQFLTEDALSEIAGYVGISKSEIMGVVTFYTMFSVRKRGKNVIRVCISPPCHMMGSKSIIEYLKNALKIKDGETTEDGIFTLETASCLGVCAVAPAMMINNEVYGNLTPEKIDEILNSYKE